MLHALLFSLLTSVASATTLKIQDIRAMEEEYAPRVEAAAGRSFVRLPAVAIASRQGLKDGFAARLKGQHTGSPEELERKTAAAGARVDNAVALYSFSDRTLYLLNDGVDELFRAWGLSPEMLLPVVRCLVVHELTHALQHQHSTLMWQLDSDAFPEARDLTEGQATLVQHQVARDLGLAAINARLELAQGLPLPASVPSQGGLPGGTAQARLLLAEAEAEGGTEAVWALLTPEAIASGEVASRASAVLPAGWRQDAPLREAGQTLLGRHEATVRTDLLLTTALQQPMAAWPPLQEVPVAIGGWRLQATHDPNARPDLFLAALRFADPKEPERLIAARRVQISATLDFLSAYPSYVRAADPYRYRMRRPRGMVRRKGLDDALLTTTDQGASGIREAWLADDGVAVVVSAGAEVVASSSALVRAAAGVLDAYRALEGDTGAHLARALAALEAPTPTGPVLTAPPAWTWHMDQIAASLDAGDPGAALEEAERALAEDPGPGRATLTQTAFHCAVRASDLAATERTFARLDAAGGVTDDDLDLYASLLEANDRSEEAREVRARLCAQAPGWEGCP